MFVIISVIVLLFLVIPVQTRDCFVEVRFFCQHGVRLPIVYMAEFYRFVCSQQLYPYKNLCVSILMASFFYVAVIFRIDGV